MPAGCCSLQMICCREVCAHILVSGLKSQQPSTRPFSALLFDRQKQAANQPCLEHITSPQRGHHVHGNTAVRQTRQRKAGCHKAIHGTTATTADTPNTAPTTATATTTTNQHRQKSLRRGPSSHPSRKCRPTKFQLRIQHACSAKTDLSCRHKDEHFCCHE
jgi:hypothetical protein